jgi:hypothetical protein
MERLESDPNIKYDLTKTHMIGYDLGAHFLHHVAFHFKTRNPLNLFPPQINRLTGLDPAGMFQFGGFLFAFFAVEDIQRSTAV